MKNMECLKGDQRKSMGEKKSGTLEVAGYIGELMEVGDVIIEGGHQIFPKVDISVMQVFAAWLVRGITTSYAFPVVTLLVEETATINYQGDAKRRHWFFCAGGKKL